MPAWLYPGLSEVTAALEDTHYCSDSAWTFSAFTPVGGGSGALRWVDSTLCCGNLRVDAGFLMLPALVFVGRELDRLVLRARVDHLGHWILPRKSLNGGSGSYC